MKLEKWKCELRTQVRGWPQCRLWMLGAWDAETVSGAGGRKMLLERAVGHLTPPGLPEKDPSKDPIPDSSPPPVPSLSAAIRRLTVVCSFLVPEHCWGGGTFYTVNLKPEKMILFVNW